MPRDYEQLSVPSAQGRGCMPAGSLAEQVSDVCLSIRCAMAKPTADVHSRRHGCCARKACAWRAMM